LSLRLAIGAEDGGAVNEIGTKPSHCWPPRQFRHAIGGVYRDAGAIGTTVAPEASAIIVGDSTVRPFGINEAVPIDFNRDGQIDLEIDHDRVDLGNGKVVDYLQLDKNDINGASLGESLLPIDPFANFPLNGTHPNGKGKHSQLYVTPTANASDYPAALIAGALIGPDLPFCFQEGGKIRTRANRLIDEDAGQVDMLFGGLTSAEVMPPTNGPNFLGLAGETRYLGVQMYLNDQSFVPAYGWIGVRITNEADATGEVVGWAYETSGLPIRAGQIPEPGTVFNAIIGAAIIIGYGLFRRLSNAERYRGISCISRRPSVSIN
jgi:hypothetical protein